MFSYLSCLFCSPLDMFSWKQCNQLYIKTNAICIMSVKKIIAWFLKCNFSIHPVSFCYFDFQMLFYRNFSSNYFALEPWGTVSKLDLAEKILALRNLKHAGESIFLKVSQSSIAHHIFMSWGVLYLNNCSIFSNMNA